MNRRACIFGVTSTVTASLVDSVAVAFALKAHERYDAVEGACAAEDGADDGTDDDAGAGAEDAGREEVVDGRARARISTATPPRTGYVARPVPTSCRVAAAPTSRSVTSATTT